MPKSLTLVAMAFVVSGVIGDRAVAEIKLPSLITLAPVVINRSPMPEKGDLLDFLAVMADRESNRHYGVVNRFGFMGAYQFSETTLRGLGTEFKVSSRHFLAHPALQDSAMVAYLRRNRDFLDPIIRRYDGKWFRGIYVTESGILAGAHLVGPLGVVAFFTRQSIVMTPHGYYITPILTDANGTTINDYLKQFSGYTLRLQP